MNPFSPMMGDRYDAPAIRGRQVHALLLAHSPKFTDVSVVAAWNGSLEIAAKRLLYFGDMPQPARVLHGQGNNSSGIGPRYSARRLLASLALDLGRPWSLWCLEGKPRCVFHRVPYVNWGHVNESDRAAKYAA